MKEARGSDCLVMLIAVAAGLVVVVFFMLFNPFCGFSCCSMLYSVVSMLCSVVLCEFSVLNVLEALFCSLLHARVDVLEQEIVALLLPTYSLYVGVLASR